MTTTAEGVETHEQLDVVLDAGCTEAQGYYFNRPLPEQEFRSLFNGDGSAQPARLRARRA
jgi:EAL domain-containing protein (putative c-di-GMP-specific phosphodiesterase class I)